MGKLNNPKQILDEVDRLSNFSLKRRDDLFTIIQLASENGLENHLNEVTFNAKYIMGLLRVLKSVSEKPEVNEFEHVKKDLSASFEKVKEQLKHIIQKDELLNVRFEAEYFSMNQTSFNSLTELLHDLEWTKKYFNIQKRSKKN